MKIKMGTGFRRNDEGAMAVGAPRDTATTSLAGCGDNRTMRHPELRADAVRMHSPHATCTLKPMEPDAHHMLWQHVTRMDDVRPWAGHNAGDSSAPELTPVARVAFDRVRHGPELERPSAR
ncbi:MAG: hypothetical protein HOQ32_17595 [Lysobacter sp.]|nr:hypothetical protein [Lysobacter sp.]